MSINSTRQRMHWFLLLVCLLTLISGSFVATQTAPKAQAAGSPNWATFGYDAQQTHYNPNETVLNTTNVSNVTKRWSAPTTNGLFNISSPIVANGIAYIEDQSGMVYADNAVTGALIWTYNMSTQYTVTNPGITISGNIAYIVGNNLVALDAQTGTLLWSIALSLEESYASPTIVGTTVYVSLSDATAAFDASTGTLKWKVYQQNAVFSAPAVSNGIVYQLINGGIKALDAQTGSAMWIGQTYSGMGTGLASGVVVSNGMVYANMFADQSYNEAVYAFNASGCGNTVCSPVWKVVDGSVSMLIAAPAIANGVLYIGSRSNDPQTMSNPVLLALDATTGTLLWKWFGTGNNEFDSSAAIDNGVVYDATVSGDLYAFNASGCGNTICSPLWSTTLGSGNGTQSSPVVSNGFIYIGGYTTTGSTGFLNAYSLPGYQPPVYMPPTVTNASFTGTEGQAGTGTVQAQSSSGSPLTLTATGLPSFASFKDNGNGTGTVSYSPKVGNAGAYTFGVTASDGSQTGTGTGTVTLTIAKATLPSGTWVSPTTNGNTYEPGIWYTIKAHASSPAGVDHVNFTFEDATGKWHTLCSPKLPDQGTNDIYSCYTDLHDVTYFTSGALHFSFDVYGRDGQVKKAPNGILSETYKSLKAGGVWKSPSSSFTVKTKAKLHFDASAYPSNGGYPIDHVAVTATWPELHGAWLTLCAIYPNKTSHDYPCDWIPVSSVVGGKITLSFDLYFTNKVRILAPNGTHPGVISGPQTTYNPPKSNPIAQKVRATLALLEPLMTVNNFYELNKLVLEVKDNLSCAADVRLLGIPPSTAQDCLAAWDNIKSLVPKPVY